MQRLIKICGLSTPETLDAAVDAGATHIGLVHFEPSPRHVSLEDAAKLRRRVPETVKVVLLLVNAQPEPTERAFHTVRPDIIQFHGTETPEWLALVKKYLDAEIWKAVGLQDAGTLERSRKYHGIAHRLLFDAPAQSLPGGNGTGFDWRLIADRPPEVPWGLAGGLDPANVAEAIRVTGAPLVDVSSGVESAPGIKDVDRIEAFCKAVREA
jgi:phosphoribosylanthranilate isomerase